MLDCSTEEGAYEEEEAPFPVYEERYGRRVKDSK